MTEGGDIGFRVYYKDSEGVIDDLVPLSRIESHLVTEEGELICARTGKCNYSKMNSNFIFSTDFNRFSVSDVVTFDNTYSIVRPKKIRYSIVVDPPAPGSPLSS